MIDFPIDELLDDAPCLRWLERRLHPDGLRCPRCGESQRRLAQQNGSWTAWRCKACDRYYTLLSGTVFERTRQSPSKLVLLLRGIAKGEPTARLARELGIGRVRLHKLRQRLQRNLLRTLPTEPLPDEVLEADELYQNAGKKGEAHRDPADPPRRRANKWRGHGSYEVDRPPVFLVRGRESGLVRYFVRHHADGATCLEVVKAAAKPRARVLDTDEWRGYARIEAATGLRHSAVRHGRAGRGRREWARDDDGDGVREVHCNGCEGAGTGLRSYLRVFRGVHKKHLSHYVATYETMTNAKEFTAAILQRMCPSRLDPQSKET